jgi:hypothetical protein
LFEIWSLKHSKRCSSNGTWHIGGQNARVAPRGPGVPPPCPWRPPPRLVGHAPETHDVRASPERIPLGPRPKPRVVACRPRRPDPPAAFPALRALVDAHHPLTRLPGHRGNTPLTPPCARPPIKDSSSPSSCAHTAPSPAIATAAVKGPLCPLPQPTELLHASPRT